MLHNKLPVKPDAVNVELSQLLTIDICGAAGRPIGAAVPLPSGLVHPFDDCVTVYVPGVVTVIDVVVSPVLHNKLPVNDSAVNTELEQLFTTVITGAAGSDLGAAIPIPALLVHPFTV